MKEETLAGFGGADDDVGDSVDDIVDILDDIVDIVDECVDIFDDIRSCAALRAADLGLSGQDAFLSFRLELDTYSNLTFKG